jgi:hypothetical protein
MRFDEADSTEFDKPSEAEAYSCIQLCLGGQGVLLPKLRPLTVMAFPTNFSRSYDMLYEVSLYEGNELTKAKGRNVIYT